MDFEIIIDTINQVCICSGKSCENICGKWKNGYIKIKNNENHNQSRLEYLTEMDIVKYCEKRITEEKLKEKQSDIHISYREPIAFTMTQEERDYLGREMLLVREPFDKPRKVIISRLLGDGYIAYEKEKFLKGKSRDIVSFIDHFQDTLKSKMKEAREKRKTI